MSGYYLTAAFLWYCPWTKETVWVNDSNIDLGNGKNLGTTTMTFESNIFEGCTNLKTVEFPNQGLVNVGTDWFVGCTSLEEVSNINVSYFRPGATPFKDVPATATIKFNTATPVLDDTADLFYATDDNKVSAPNHAWFTTIVAEKILFKYSTVLNYEVDADGLVTKLDVEYHDHNSGCPVCAPLRSPAAYETLQGYLSLTDGETLADETLSGLIRTIESYNEETGEVVFTMYHGYFYDIPIVVEAVLASNAVSNVPFITGTQATVKGTVACIDGVIHFTADSTVTKIANMGWAYVSGNTLYAGGIPTEVKGAQRIRMPDYLTLDRMEYFKNNDYDGYYWGSDNEGVITFETVVEDGKEVVYMVVTPGTTTQTVKISVRTTYWEMIDYMDYFYITVKP
jgi:hypothetical protein